MVESELGGLRELRCLITGGDVVTPEHVKRFLEAVPNCRLTDGYGPTENTTFSCCYTVPSLDAIRDGVPIGRPIANSTAYVLDSDLQPVEVGTPDLTAERFIADPFSSEPGARLYRTGDMARARADGVLEFLGRIDHQFKIRGFRVELGEIESALRTFPAISDCAVTVVTQGGENVLCAYVVPMRGREMEERELRAHLSTWLPRHMLPTHITVVEALPANSSGKIDRQTLAATSRTLVGQTDHRIADSRASNGAGTSSWKERPTKQRQVALRRTISNLWLESVGGGTELDVDTNFFDAGGDSLRLLKLHERLQHVCDVEVPLFALFENGTIRKMTALVSSLTE
jgi:acyl-CoA synthetase (AMP-forming)/AMP-acid ligase II/aryl carrier-like protein